jgi:hypothetical protein
MPKKGKQAKPERKSERSDLKIHPARIVVASTLKQHPKNYRRHPPEQLRHLGESLKQHGQYKNIVVAKDDTILAGHGIYQAAIAVGMKQVSVVKLDIASDSPRAQKIVAADNKLPDFAEDDEKMLAEMLLIISKDDADGLTGTGFDDQSLAALLASVRPPEGKFDASAEWEGMPEFDHSDKQGFQSIVLHFHDQAGVDKFAKLVKQKITPKTRYLWYPEMVIERLVDKVYEG